MRVHRLLKSSLALLTLLGASAGIADKFQDQVRSNLQARYDYWHAKNGGYTKLPDLRDIDVIHTGNYITITYTLVAGRTYKVLGACDNQCSNLDLEMRDDKGVLLDNDNADDNIPIIDMKARRTGDYKLKVIMSACASTNGCAYGVDVYRAK